MRTIADLEAQIAEATALLEDAERRAEHSPSAELSASSLSAHIKDLQGQLHAQKQRRAREVVELRLRGSQAELGSLPLDLLGKMTSELARALGHTARMIRFGTDGRIRKDIAQTLDLRLEGMGAGSTKLFITGETAPDLFGNSLLEDTLQDTFALLQASSDDELAEVVSHVGAQAAGAFKNFFRVIGSAQLALDVTWETPAEKELIWSAEAWRVRQLSERLSKLTSEEPEIIHLAGNIVTLSARRPFELRTSEGDEYSARVPDKLANDIKDFKVGQRVVVTMERQTVKNTVTGLERSTLTLLTIAAA